MLHYKFVELSTVTDESMELAVNECIAHGWNFEGVHFAMAAGSKRPAMAFLTFTRDLPLATEDGDTETAAQSTD